MSHRAFTQSYNVKGHSFQPNLYRPSRYSTAEALLNLLNSDTIKNALFNRGVCLDVVRLS